MFFKITAVFSGCEGSLSHGSNGYVSIDPLWEHNAPSASSSEFVALINFSKLFQHEFWFLFLKSYEFEGLGLSSPGLAMGRHMYRSRQGDGKSMSQAEFFKCT